MGTLVGAIAGWLLRNHVGKDPLIVVVLAAVAGTVLAAVLLHVRVKRLRAGGRVAAT